VPDWRSYFIALAVVGVLALILRWAFGGRSRSLVQRQAQAGHDDEYGLMVAIASPGSFIEGEVARQQLAAAGIRASLVTTSDGPRVMVFRSDEARARHVLSG
jgi:hypothetical protein